MNTGTILLLGDGFKLLRENIIACMYGPQMVVCSSTFNLEISTFVKIIEAVLASSVSH